MRITHGNSRYKSCNRPVTATHISGRLLHTISHLMAVDLAFCVHWAGRQCPNTGALWTLSGKYSTAEVRDAGSWLHDLPVHEMPPSSIPFSQWQNILGLQRRRTDFQLLLSATDHKIWLSSIWLSRGLSSLSHKQQGLRKLALNILCLLIPVASSYTWLIHSNHFYFPSQSKKILQRCTCFLENILPMDTVWHMLQYLHSDGFP